jgi:biopolymer transport protein ExbD
MALTNCTINSDSLIKTGGSAIGSDNAQLIITPNSGYVVSASNFTVDPASITGVSSISLSDSTSAGAVGNTVLVDVDLDDTYVMPSQDTTITIDVDGSADLIQYSIAGTYDTDVTNATPSSETDTAYSATGNYGVQTTLFIKSFTASSGYYFATPPSAQIITGNTNHYSITHTDTNDSEGNLVTRAFTVKYTFQNYNVSGDDISFTASAIEIPDETAEITAYNVNTDNIVEQGETRSYTVYGGPGAVFSVTVVDSGSTTIDSISNITMPSTGSYTYNITFPSISSGGSETYTITITGDLSSNFDTASGQNSAINITQLSTVDLTLSITTTDSNITVSSAQATNLPAFETAFGTNDTISLSFTLTGSSNIYLRDLPIDEDDFTNQLNSNLSYEVTSVSVTGNNTTSVTVVVNANIYETTNVSLSSVLDIDGYINATPVANGVSLSVSKGQSSSVTLDATDADGDSLTYYIVSLPSNGTLYSDSGLTTAISAGASITGATVYYEHDNSNNLTDSFTYKANDGLEDSNTATVNVAVGVSPGASISTSGGAGIYLVPLVVGTNAGTLKVHFNAISVPDRFQILFDTADASNNVADMDIVADSLYVGDSTSASDPANGTTTGLDEYTYVGSGGDATGAGEPGAAWNKTGNANQSITVADTDVTVDSTTRSNDPGDTTSLGVSRNTSGTQTSQLNVQSGVYISNVATGLTTGLQKRDGNICLYYTKAATSTAYTAYLRVYGHPTSSTTWHVYQTEFSEQFGTEFKQTTNGCSETTKNSIYLAYVEDNSWATGKTVYIDSAQTTVLNGGGNTYKFYTDSYGLTATVSSSGVLSGVIPCTP